MKITFFILSLSLFAATCGDDQKEKTVPKTSVEEVTSHSKFCERSTVPELDSLNKKARLTYNLADYCDFQPVHIAIREHGDSSELIARFNGKKIDEDTFEIDSIEFKNYIITSSLKRIIVDSVYLDSASSAGVTKFLVDLINLDDCSQHTGNIKEKCIKKQSKKKGVLEIDYMFRQSLIIKKGTIMDFKITNEMDIYGDGFVPKGEQCKGNTMF